jgi:hypothetical protein
MGRVAGLRAEARPAVTVQHDLTRESYGDTLVFLDDVVGADGVHALAVATPAAFERLSEYSCSLPTGKYDGKVWKARGPNGWMLGEYRDDGEPGFLTIVWRDLVVMEG